MQKLKTVFEDNKINIAKHQVSNLKKILAMTKLNVDIIHASSKSICLFFFSLSTMWYNRRYNGLLAFQLKVIS